MKRIGDLDVDSFYRAIDFWGERITEGFKRIEITKESIWSINPKARVWFYGILSFVGIAVSLFTVCTMCGKQDTSWVEVFDALWNGIIGSVVVVWFGFQVTDWFKVNVLTKIKIMAWGDPAREKLREEGRQEARQEAHQKEMQKQSRFEEGLKNEGVSDETIQNAKRFLNSYSQH